MNMRRRLLGLSAPLGVAAVLVASQTIAMAYPPPPAAAKLATGCTNVNTGASCTYSFDFTDSTGAGDDGLTVTFALDEVPGCTISPTSGTTSGGGFASTTFTCASNAGTGTDVLTATSGGVSASATININPANAGGGGQLPFTGTNPPGPNGWLIAGLTLAAAIIVAGASYLTLNRRRRPAA
jgi:hypothetical protein